MTTLEELRNKIPQIEEAIHYEFKNKELLLLAFIHRSYVNEHKEIGQHNERLEFLGDSVLGLITASYLYNFLPETSEGDLSYLRSRLVEASSCVTYLQQIHIQKFLLLGKGERMNDGRGRETILADLFEAIVGAIYLDGGLEAARSFIFSHLTSVINNILKTPLQNWKALLQDYCQKKYQQPPDYILIHETGPDHSKQFEIAVQIQGQEFGRGFGTSKKEAQQAAAKEATTRLNLNPNDC